MSAAAERGGMRDHRHPPPVLPVVAPNQPELDHRGGSRLAARVRLHGPQALSDAELLAVGARIAPALAGSVLGRLPFEGQVRPRADELAAAGLAPTAAVRLAALMELAHRRVTAPPDGAWRIRSPADVASQLMGAMGALEREELWVALLNTKNVVTGLSAVYAGSVAGCTIRVGEVFRDAVRSGSAALIVVHNHPSGDPTPSAEDVQVTAELATAGRLLDIPVLDHVVIGRGAWTSLRALGVLTG